MQANLLGMMAGDEKGMNTAEALQDPQLQQLQGTEEAGPEEEQQLGEAMSIAGDFMYSDEGMAAIANMFQKDSRPLWQVIPEMGKMILERVHGEMPDADPSIWFGEGGMLQQMPTMLFEIAEQMEVPGYDDPEMLAAATIGLYKEVGQYLTEMGDEDAKEQAMQLGAETLLTGDDGQMMAPEKATRQAIKQSPEMKGLPKNIKNLLGV